MVRQNQGFRKDLNLQENINDTQTLSNLAGAGLANDLRIIQNNLRNISTVAYNTLSNGFFYFGDNSVFVFTNDDIVTVDRNVSVGSTTLFPTQNYYVCNSDGEKRFKLSRTPSVVGVNTINVTGVSPGSFLFIRKDPVSRDNIQNIIKPQIQDTNNFNYINGGSINSAIANIQDSLEATKFFIDKKYKGSSNTTTDKDIRIEGSVNIEDPARLNTGTAGLADPKSPGVFIGNTRAFSSDNNPWTKVGTALSTSSSEVSIGELYFSNNISISGISTETATSIDVTSFTHKLPVVINGETYYLLLST